MKLDPSLQQFVQALTNWRSKLVVVHDEFSLRQHLRISYSEPDVSPNELTLIKLENIDIESWPTNDNVIAGQLNDFEVNGREVMITVGDSTIRARVSEGTSITHGRLFDEGEE